MPSGQTRSSRGRRAVPPSVSEAEKSLLEVPTPLAPISFQKRFPLADCCARAAGDGHGAYPHQR
jgi:hypothetical protein